MSDVLHIGRDGTPRKCVAKPGECPLAHPMAHFAKAEEGMAQRFADEYNKMKVKLLRQGGTDPYFVGPRDEVSVIASSVAISEYCEAELDKKFGKGTTKKAFKNPIKWQKQQRNKFLREMVALDGRQKEILNILMDKQAAIKQTQNAIWTPGLSKAQIKGLREVLRNQRKEFKHLMTTYSKETVSNERKYGSSLSKKQEHEEVLINHLKDQNEFEALSNTYFENEDILRSIQSRKKVEQTLSHVQEDFNEYAHHTQGVKLSLSEVEDAISQVENKEDACKIVAQDYMHYRTGALTRDFVSFNSSTTQSREDGSKWYEVDYSYTDRETGVQENSRFGFGIAKGKFTSDDLYFNDYRKERKDTEVAKLLEK